MFLSLSLAMILPFVANSNTRFVSILNDKEEGILFLFFKIIDSFNFVDITL